MKQHLSRDAVRKTIDAANPGWTKRQWALAGAWFFIGASLMPLVWAAVVEPADSVRILGTSVDGRQHAVWGLAYEGATGRALLWFELLAVGAAALATLLPIRRFRRLGHLTLIGWAGLWTIGAWGLATVSPGEWGPGALLLSALLGCTIFRAVDSKRRRRVVTFRKTPEAPMEPAPPFAADNADSHFEADRPCAPGDPAGGRVAWRDRLERDLARVRAQAAPHVREARAAAEKAWTSAKRHWPRWRDGGERCCGQSTSASRTA